MSLHLKPKYEGELTLQHIQKETTVYFDDFMRHIFMPLPIKTTALGQGHAQRSFMANGVNASHCTWSTSELFLVPRMQKNDKFFSGLGLKLLLKSDRCLDKKIVKSYQLPWLTLMELIFLENGPYSN
jgi:penicillin amidase